MKKVMLLGAFLLCTTLSQAQNVQEWINQRQTQIKYLTQQIAALQMYISHGRKAYGIAEKGLGNISLQSGGEYSSHQGYFRSLREVNHIIVNHPVRDEIISLDEQIQRNARLAILMLHQSEVFSSGELHYFQEVYSRVVEDSKAVVRMMAILLEDYSLEMNDQQRLERLDELRSEIISQYEFVKVFTGDAKMVAISRRQDQRDIEINRRLNGINH